MPPNPREDDTKRMIKRMMMNATRQPVDSDARRDACSKACVCTMREMARLSAEEVPTTPENGRCPQIEIAAMTGTNRSFAYAFVFTFPLVCISSKTTDVFDSFLLIT